MKTHIIKILNIFLIFLSSISFLSFNSLFIHFIFIFCRSPSAHAFYAVAKTVHSNETERIRANCKANQVSLSIKIWTRREEERAHDTKKKCHLLFSFTVQEVNFYQCGFRLYNNYSHQQGICPVLFNSLFK